MNTGRHLLSVLVWLPALAGLLALFLPRQSPKLLRAYGVAASLFIFGQSLQLLNGTGEAGAASGFRLVENVEWIPSLGIRYHLAVDGISLWLVLLTTFLTPITLYVSFGAIRNRQKEFIAAMLILEAAMIGCFFALDMFLFYVFYEMTLVPMFLIIGVFGGKNSVYAAVKFFLYTFLGSVFMLLAILYMVMQYKTLTGHYSFGYLDLMRLGFPIGTERILFAAFTIAFAVKVPMWPVHTWLPDAHTEAPTGGSMILAAIMLKLGTYGILRFSLGLFPLAAHWIGPTIALLAVVGIVYGALAAWRQYDFKRLVAYSSVSHLGFVMLGLIGRTDSSVSGAMLQMINHGISTGALFLLVGVIYDRRHTRDVAEFGGLAKIMPWYATVFVAVTMSSIGLPGTNGFIGEFLVITGSFSSSLLRWSYRCSSGGDCDLAQIGPLFSLIAATGVILGAIYMLDVVQKVFFGPATNPKNDHLPDLNRREWAGLAPLLFMIFAMGLFPNYFRSRMDPTVHDFLVVYNAKMDALRDPGGARTRAVMLEEAVIRAPSAAAPAAAEPHAALPLRREALLAQGD
ncbi:MAG: NADH-quinone oxidoreductase subunit M [Myxococcales bacterium]|nr:NADH-quinone oxidoreductase subunit M [Myxococcales bacterium]